MTMLHVLHHLGMVRFLAGSPLMTLATRKRGMATIFMLHRFGTDAGGHDPTVVRRLLIWLRSHRFDLLDLEEAFRRLRGEGPPLGRAVAFTIDDGYRCQAEVAAPIFAEHEAPVTTFLTTGFIDGTLWLWWDKVEYVLKHAPVDRLTLEAGERRLDLDLQGPRRRRLATEQLTEHLKSLAEADRLAAITELSERALVPIPDTPPYAYRPMTWDQVRRCEAGGMRFGPHTVTHPVLARTDAAQSHREIEQSWQRLTSEVARPVPVFCYPNGRDSDFGPRESAILQDLGFLGAVTAEGGYATAAGFSGSEGAFRVPRFSFSDAHEENLRYASRLEWLWQQVRLRVG
jgi:peptidoglycan/xylan/chitin deacetylase (PgdA/CDA1 family)